MAGLESGRNARWRDWYPTVVPNFSEIGLEQSPYGEANKETLEIFKGLPKGSTVLDVGGGDGRFALPLASMGHNVLVMDVDQTHLQRVQEKKVLLENAGEILPFQGDAMSDFPIKDESVDAVLNAGLGYLIPPKELDPLFGRMAKTLKPGGLLVFEFATNRERKTSKDASTSLLGKNEYNYPLLEGVEVLFDLYIKYGFDTISGNRKKVQFEKPYYMHNDLIIAQGRKK